MNPLEGSGGGLYYLGFIHLFILIKIKISHDTNQYAAIQFLFVCFLCLLVCDLFLVCTIKRMNKMYKCRLDFDTEPLHDTWPQD